MRGSSSTLLRVVAGAALILALVMLTWWLLADTAQGSETADVLGLPATILFGLISAVVGVRARALRKDEADERRFGEAVDLAGKVRRREGAALGQLMADTGAAESVEVHFVRPEAALWRTDGGEKSGTSSQVADYYRNLGDGRLVVLGPAGSGKTVLAIRLVLELAKLVEHADPQRRNSAGAKRVRVPVRMSAPAFHPAAYGTNIQVLTAEYLSAQLEEWLANQLERNYGLPKRLAKDLVISDWILPVFDGVDEMDPVGAPPHHAQALIAALNQPTADGVRAVVLTCRSDRYRDLASAASPYVGDRSVLQDSTAVEVAQLSASAVRAFLLRRFPDPDGSDDGDPRWQPVLNRLAANRPDDPLVAVLCSPLRLFLAVTAFRRPTAEPGRLTSFRSATELDDQLFAQFVPAVTEIRPVTRTDRYRSESVSRWLSTLAWHLNTEERANLSGTDLQLEQLWPIAGDRTPRYVPAAIFTVAAAAPLYLLWMRHLVSVGFPRDAFIGLSVILSVCLVVMIAVNTTRRKTSLHRLDVRQLATPPGRRAFASWLAGGFLIGLAYGVAVGLAGGFAGGTVVGLSAGLTFGLVGGLIFGLALGVSFGLATRPEAIRVPSQLVRQGIANTIARSAVGLAVALPLALAANLTMGLVFGLLFGLAAISTAPWPRYGVACLLLARRRDTPFRIARFLDWAYAAGFLRLAGTAVQFRHREFQTWLTTQTAKSRRD
jgi:hypothetical protein